MSETFTPLEIALGAHFHVQHGTETTVFLPAAGEASWSLFRV